MIATLISSIWLEERVISTKSDFIHFLLDTVLALQTQITEKDESCFSEMENSIIYETNTTVDNTQEDVRTPLDGCF